MRVMLDTNVLVSALLFSGETINTMMRKVKGIKLFALG